MLGEGRDVSKSFKPEIFERYFSILLISLIVKFGSEDTRFISIGFPLGGPALCVRVSTLIPAIIDVASLISDIIKSDLRLLSQSLNSISIKPIISGELSCLLETFPDVV